MIMFPTILYENFIAKQMLFASYSAKQMLSVSYSAKNIGAALERVAKVTCLTWLNLGSHEPCSQIRSFMFSLITILNSK